MLKQKSKSFALNATLLALGGLICKIIGALYRVPLVKVLGTTGIGVYQTAFPLFAILLTLSSGGIAQTVSALVSSSDRNEVSGVVRGGFSVVGVATFALSVFMYFLSPIFSQIQGVPEAVECYRVLTPALVLSGFSAVIKGYFQAYSNVTPTIISQLIEQITKLVFGLCLSYYFISEGILTGVVGALIGVSISELLCFLFLFIRYIFRKNKEPSLSVSPKSYEFIRVLRYSIPLALGGIILPLSSLVDSVTVVNILSTTTSLQEATSLYGIQTGVVSTISNLPAVFTVALGVTVIPIVRAKCQNNGTRVLEKGRISIKLALLVCIPASILFALLSIHIIDLLYPSMTAYERGVGAVCLSISSVGITFLGVTQIYSSLLFSVGLSSVSTKNLLIAVLVKCVLTVPAVRLFGIYGVSGATVLCYVLSALLNAHSWHKLDPQSDPRSLALLLLASVSCTLPVFLAKYYLSTSILFALTLLCVVLYLYMVVKIGALTFDEAVSIPFLRPFLKRARKKK